MSTTASELIGVVPSNEAHKQDYSATDSAFGSAELGTLADQTNKETAVKTLAPSTRNDNTCFTVFPVKPQSVEPTSTVNKLKFKPFNEKEKQSWLSGHPDKGFIRLFDPNSHLKSSLVVPCTENTTCKEICGKLSLKTTCLHLQYSGDVIRTLGANEHPLVIQNEYLERIGMFDIKRQQQLGDTLALGYLIRFYAGRPQSEDVSRGQSILSAYCCVRKGRLFHYWSRRLCILNGARVFMYPNTDKSGEPEVISLSRSKVEEVQLRSRGRSIKITISPSRKPPFTLYLNFDSMLDLDAWLSRCIKVSAKVPPVSDLSNLQMESLPEHLFAVGSERLLTQLNLRRNRLRERPPHAPIFSRGWLDEISAFQSLRTLNLADNCLRKFPMCVLQLPALTELNLSSNKISQLPLKISRLKNLQTLNLQNNWLTWLPLELADCQALNSVDISFNRFAAVPTVLTRLPQLKSWQLTGNDIENFHTDKLLPHMGHLQRIYIARNRVALTKGIPMGYVDHLTDLHIQNNPGLQSLDLRSLSSLRCLHCERTDLAGLQLNGTFLTHLFASDNELKSVVVMPVPQMLKEFDVSQNRLTKLPDWLTEISHIEKILAANNRLNVIPHRLFTNVSSLKRLVLHHNEIRCLPTQIENCFLEHLDLHHNKLTHLPHEFLASTHKLRVLNLAQNLLTSLPPLNPFQDLNKVTHLILSSNRLTDAILPIISDYRRLRVLDLGYNHLRNIDSNWIEKLHSLEELNLSGNRLTGLPSTICELPSLAVLRSHSNRIVNLPDLSRCQHLKVLDVGSNRLECVDVRFLLSSHMKHLDLSCNPRMVLDTTAFRQYQSDKMVSLIDMSQEAQVQLVTSTEVPWQAGFSETSGERNKLCIAQIRCSLFQPKLAGHSGALYGIIDGGLNNEIPFQLQNLLPRKLLDEISKNTCGVDTLHYALIGGHASLGSAGQKMGASATLCHIVPIKDEGAEASYKLYVANVGHTEVVMCRKGQPVVLSKNFMLANQPVGSSEYERVKKSGGIVTQANDINGIAPCSRMLGCSFLYPSVIPTPYVTSVDLGEPDEFLIVASRGLWERISWKEAVRRIRYIPNPIHAAKHLQDMARAYGYLENLSVLVVRFFFSEMPVAPEFPLLPITIGTGRMMGQAQSALNIAESDSITDDEVQSEPQGKPVKQTPNYYFEYKKKLKELMLDEDTSSENSSLCTLHQEIDIHEDAAEDMRSDGYLTPLNTAHPIELDDYYNPWETEPVHLTKYEEVAATKQPTVQELLNASFHSEIQKEMQRDSSDSELPLSLSASMEQLNHQHQVIMNKESNSTDSGTSSSGLGKPAALPPNSLAFPSYSGGATFQLVARRKEIVAGPEVRHDLSDTVEVRLRAKPGRDASTMLIKTSEENDACPSRIRFETARQQVMKKLQLAIPAETDAPPNVLKLSVGATKEPLYDIPQKSINSGT